MTTANFDTLPDSAQITAKQVAEILGVHIATVWRMVQNNTLPQPNRFGTRCTRWLCGDIRRLIGAERKAA